MIPITALLLAAPFALFPPSGQGCDPMRSGGWPSSSGTHINSDYDVNSSIVRFSNSDGRKCTSATLL